MIDPGLTGKVALVTGGNNPHGIGAAAAQALAAQGAAVFIHYFRQPADESNAPDADRPGIPFFMKMQSKSPAEAVDAIRGAGGQADCCEGDLADPDLVPTLFDRAEQQLGPVDILVNNAADYLADTFLPPETPEQADRALWDGGPLSTTLTAASCDRHFAVNTRAPALLMAEFARRHIARGQSWGRIINVSADCSWGCPGEISYRASQHALESYTRSAAAELGPFGVTANIVSPGPVQTGYITEQGEKDLIADIPLRRVGQPEDIADTVVFLASEQARWITGQLIYVHGGHRMGLGR